MESFKTWLKNLEAIAAEAATTSGGGGNSTSTGDIANNPYGAGITYYDRNRDNFKLKGCKGDNKNGGCDTRKGLGGSVIPMKFSSVKTVHDIPS
jgi:hypothetical protein